MSLFSLRVPFLFQTSPAPREAQGLRTPADWPTVWLGACVWGTSHCTSLASVSVTLVLKTILKCITLENSQFEKEEIYHLFLITFTAKYSQSIDTADYPCDGKRTKENAVMYLVDAQKIVDFINNLFTQSSSNMPGIVPVLRVKIIPSSPEAYHLGGKIRCTYSGQWKMKATCYERDLLVSGVIVTKGHEAEKDKTWRLVVN